MPNITLTGAAPDLTGPTLLSIDVSPTTIAVDGGQVVVTVTAEDTSGVSYATVNWTNPLGSNAGLSCSNFVSGTCTTTFTVGASGSPWQFSGDYQPDTITLGDNNGVYSQYMSNGQWSEQGGTSGTHGFAFPSLTLF